MTEKIDKTDLMRKLWQAAEDASDPREVILLTLAGNLIEATFTKTDTGDAIRNAIENAMECVLERYGVDKSAFHPVFNEEDRP